MGVTHIYALLPIIDNNPPLLQAPAVNRILYLNNCSKQKLFMNVSILSYDALSGLENLVNIVWF